MRPVEPAQVCSAIDKLLDRERDALLCGQIALLDELLTEKERLFLEFAQLPPPPDSRLEPLRDKIGRNLALLDSAMEGIRAVGNRMVELQRVRRGLDVYGKSGRKQRYGTGSAPSMEKRA